MKKNYKLLLVLLLTLFFAFPVYAEENDDFFDDWDADIIDDENMQDEVVEDENMQDEVVDNDLESDADEDFDFVDEITEDENVENSQTSEYPIILVIIIAIISFVIIFKRRNVISEGV